MSNITDDTGYFDYPRKKVK